MIDCGCDEILLPQGSNGVDGKNAFTVTTVAFTQPAAAASVTITVDNTLQNTNQWAIPEQIIRITDASGRGGWYRVTSIVGTNQITAVNLDYQPGSSTAGLTIAIGAKVSPAGLQGPAGTNGDPGGQGVAGPPIVLNLGPTQTLGPGSDATASLTGSGGNYTVAFGIPSGLPGSSGKTLQFQANNTALVTNLTTTYQAVVPSSTIDTVGNLCPNNGDAFRATFFCYAQSSSSSHNGYNIQIQLGYDIGAGLVNSNVEYVGTTNATFELAINTLALPLFNNSPLAINDPKATFKFEMIVHRVSLTVARCSVDYRSDNGFKAKSGLFSVDLPFDFTATATKKIQVNMASSTGGQETRISKWSLLIEKITA